MTGTAPQDAVGEPLRPSNQAPVHHGPGGIRLEPSARRIRVWSGDVLLADSRRAILLHEGHHPLRHYLPPEDVRLELLAQATQSSYCPFKGEAVHYALASGDDARSVAWSYPVPLAGMEPLAGLIAFYQERVVLDSDQDG